MGKAPEKCPMCGEKDKWIMVDSGNKGFSVGKAAAGALLLGPVGLIGGALGKHKESCTSFSQSSVLFNIIRYKEALLLTIE